MASVPKVKFHYLKSMDSPRILNTKKLTIWPRDPKGATLYRVAELFGRSSVGVVDKQGRRASLGTAPWPSEFYVTEYACTYRCCGSNFKFCENIQVFIFND